LVGGAGLLVVRGVRRRDWAAFFDLSLVGFLLFYLLAHWLWSFLVWDRYLLPLAPLAGILLGRVILVLLRGTAARVTAATQRWLVALALAALLACLVASAGRAIGGQVPVGAGQAAYDGIEQVTTFLGGLSEGSVLYHWLGWEYDFYLFDAPLYLAYWPTPAWLAQDVQAFGEAEPRYIVFPAWESSARVEAALADVGYRLEAVLEARTGGEVRFTVYRVRPALAVPDRRPDVWQ
jgi:hypothetical protein